MNTQEEIDVKLAFDSRLGDLCRGRTLAVGLNLNGLTEISIRQNNSTATWILLKNSDIQNLINILAANIGCSVVIQPNVSVM